MRQEYWQLAFRALAQGRWRWLADQAYKRVAVKRGMRRGRPACGPILGSILVTYRCDNRCLMCDYPQQAIARGKEGDIELDEKELRAVVDDFAAIGSSSVSFTGGEPLLRPDIFDLLNQVHNRGMLSNINSNANLLAKEDLAEDLLKTGVDLINISVDGATAGVHDTLRGVKGGFDKLCTAIETFNRLKTDKGYKSLVNVVTVVSKENLRQIPDVLELARELKVNKIGFMPVHEFDFFEGRETDILRDGAPDWLEDLDEVIALLQREVKTGLVDNSVDYLAMFRDCFLNKPLTIPCTAAYSSLMVNTYGEIFPCFPWIERRKSVGNVRVTPIREFWDSDEYNAQRPEILACRDCHWNCHTELSLALR